MLTSEVDVGVTCGGYVGSVICVSLYCGFVIVVWNIILVDIVLGIVGVLVGVGNFACGWQLVSDHLVVVIFQECVFGLDDIV